MKTAILRSFAALLVGLALGAQAAPPTDASLDELNEITKTRQMLDQMHTMMERVMRQQMDESIGRAHLTPQQRLQLDGLMAECLGIMREEVGWEKMRAVMNQVYRETFTQEEVDGLIAFYRTPTGVALIEKMPAAMNRSMQLMQASMRPAMERMQARVAQRVAEAQKSK